MNAFAAIESALVALLSASPAVAALVQASPVRPLAAQHASGAFVRAGNAELEPAAILGAPLQAQTPFVIDLVALGDLDTTSAQAHDERMRLVAERVAAGPTLGGLAMDCALKAIEFDTEPGEKPAHRCTLVFQVLHQLSASTLTANT